MIVVRFLKNKSNKKPLHVCIKYIPCATECIHLIDYDSFGPNLNNVTGMS